LAIEALERQIADQDVAALVANFPCNPTGAVIDADDAAAIGALAKRTGVLIIADEVYARLRYDGRPPVSLLAHAPDHVVSIGSASKEYLLPGARVGYMLSAHSQLTDRVLRRLVRANTASPNVIGQTMLLERLESDLDDLRAGRSPALIGRIRDAMQARRDALLEVLERHGMPAAGRPPEGTIFLMATLPDWWRGDDVSFSERALELALFSCIPGSSFGLEGTVRLSFGATDLAAIERLDAGLAQLRSAILP
jgi:aminotransferase